MRPRRTAIAAGALIVTTAIAIAPMAAQAVDEPAGGDAATRTAGSDNGRAIARLSVHKVRRNVMTGRSIVVSGSLVTESPARGVRLQARYRRGWRTVDRVRAGADGLYRLKWRAVSSRRLRVQFAGDAQTGRVVRSVGRAHVYRAALASWYGPGLYGNPLGCGGRLTPHTIGVAHKTLPCGTKVTLRYRGRTVRARVIDRGPFVAAREFDLTAATKTRLGFGSTGNILVSA